MYALPVGELCALCYQNHFVTASDPPQHKQAWSLTQKVSVLQRRSIKLRPRLTGGLVQPRFAWGVRLVCTTGVLKLRFWLVCYGYVFLDLMVVKGLIWLGVSTALAS